MTAEGWGGQSLRQHIESVAAMAGEGSECAELASAKADEAAGEAGRALDGIEGLQNGLLALTEQVDALSEVRGLAEAAHDEVAALRAEMAELAARLGGAVDAPSHGGLA
jgi:hypothetical protein